MVAFRFGYWTALLILPMALSATEDASVRLQYHAKEPVVQRSRVSVQMTQAKADHPTSIWGFQELEAHVQINEQPKSPPYRLTMTVDRLRVGVETGEKKVEFDSNSPQESAFLSELFRVIGEPIQISVGENLQLQSSSQEFPQLTRDLRLLGGFNLSSLFSEMVQQLFALADRPLRVGELYPRSLKLGAAGGAPVEVTYRVVGITADEVRATITGHIPSSTLTLPQGVLGAAAPAATLQFSGTIDGKVVWSRQNALVYKTKIDYRYQGTVAENGRQWPFQLQMRHADSTQAE